MIRQATPQTKTIEWGWDSEEPSGIGTGIFFEVMIGLGEESHDGKRERFVDGFRLLRIAVQLDVPFVAGNYVLIPEASLREDDHETLERHGRKAFDESGYLDKLIW